MNYRQLELSFLSWLPSPSALTYKISGLEAEITNMAAKFYVYFLTHTIQVAKERQYRERFFTRDVLITLKGTSVYISLIFSCFFVGLLLVFGCYCSVFFC